MKQKNMQEAYKQKEKGQDAAHANEKERKHQKQMPKQQGKGKHQHELLKKHLQELEADTLAKDPLPVSDEVRGLAANVVEDQLGGQSPQRNQAGEYEEEEDQDVDPVSDVEHDVDVADLEDGEDAESRLAQDDEDGVHDGGHVV